MDERTMQTEMDSVALSTSPLNLEEGELFKAGSSMYSMVKYLGEGHFGKVALWKDLHSNETVVVKILKKTSSLYLEKEVAILKAINALGPDDINVVRFHDRIDVVGHDGLIFEQLHINLFELLWRRDCCPLSPREIRPIAVQMLLALDALKFLGILHTDIKPDNIMLVGGEDQPFRVKLIDFGNALYAYEARPGDNIQALRCRAPEVYLGLQYNEAVDMWGLGCVLAYLYLVCHLFPYIIPYKIVKGMVETLGLPEDYQLQAGMYTQRYFNKQAADPQSWRLLSPAEYTAETNLPAEDNEGYYEMPGGLDDLIDQDDSDLEYRRLFVDLLKGMLHMDGAQRLTPCQALQHPYFWAAPNLGECFDSGVNVTSCQLTGSSQDLGGPSGTQTLNAQPLYPPETQQSAGYLEDTEGNAASSTPEPEGPPAGPPGQGPSGTQTLDSQPSACSWESHGLPDAEDDAASSTPEPEGPPAGPPGQGPSGTQTLDSQPSACSWESHGLPDTQQSAGYLEDTEDDAASLTPDPEGPPAGPPGQGPSGTQNLDSQTSTCSGESNGLPDTQQSAGYLEDTEDDAASLTPDPEGPPAGPPGQGPSGTQNLDSQTSTCSGESNGAADTQQSAYRFESNEDSVINPDWSASLGHSPAPEESTDSLLSCIKLLFCGEEVQGPSGTQTLDSQPSACSWESHGLPDTQQSAGYLEDTEDDAASSTPEPEGPPAGPPGRLRKTLNRVWRGFKGVKNFFCCCLRPKTDN